MLEKHEKEALDKLIKSLSVEDRASLHLWLQMELKREKEKRMPHANPKGETCDSQIRSRTEF